MKVYNFLDNDDCQIISQQGNFKVIEWKRDLSVSKDDAMVSYFAAEMNVKKRQLVCDLDGSNGVTIQAGAMQWTLGNVQTTTGVKGVGDFFGKVMRGAVTGESAIKPEYTGSGMLVLEPTYKHIILTDTVKNMGGSMIVNDGMFLACDSSIQQQAVMTKRPSAMVAGGEGLFNLGLSGNGVVALESNVPASEIVIVDLNNEELKLDGNFALAWTTNLEFTVERSTKSLIGSAASGEGLVNVYRGTGRVMLAPVEAEPRRFPTSQDLGGNAGDDDNRDRQQSPRVGGSITPGGNVMSSIFNNFS